MILNMHLSIVNLSHGRDELQFEMCARIGKLMYLALVYSDAPIDNKILTKLKVTFTVYFPFGTCANDDFNHS
jgi:hypothetical protein